MASRVALATADGHPARAMPSTSLVLFLATFVVGCGGHISATSNGDDRGDAGPLSLREAAIDAGSDGPAAPGDAVATFPCPALQDAGESGDAGIVRCAVTTQFCASNATAGTGVCFAYDSVCHSCECVLRALQDPDEGDADVPFTYAPPMPGANGCFGDAATGVSLYLKD
jgi:hypothetical protein